MATVKGTCRTCGKTLECEVADTLASAALVAALCPGCSDLHFIEGGGCVFTLRDELQGARFPLGKVTVTPGAVTALADSSQHAVAFLGRHVRGDWGEYGRYDEIQLTDDEHRRGWEATDDSDKINKSNLLNGRDSIMSAYVTDLGRRVWIITRLDRGGGTTVLLPEEY